jgi:hypothetical protein
VETARLTGALVALLALLVRGEAPAPASLAAAGVAGLAVFGALALGRPILRRLLNAAPPPADTPPDPPPADG